MKKAPAGDVAGAKKRKAQAHARPAGKGKSAPKRAAKKPEAPSKPATVGRVKSKAPAKPTTKKAKPKAKGPTKKGVPCPAPMPENPLRARVVAMAKAHPIKAVYLDFLVAYLTDPERKTAEAWASARGIALTAQNRASMRTMGARTLHRPEVARVAEALLAEIQAEERREAEAAAAEKLEAALMTVYEKRAFLARVKRVKRTEWENEENGDLIQEWHEQVSDSGTTLKIKLPGKIAAIEADNELAGHGAKFKVSQVAGNALLDLVLAVRGGGR